jgi:putative oxidoreductase
MAIESLFGVNADVASFILRVAVGSLFMIHGYPKLGSQRETGRGFMKSTGMPANMIAFAGVVELFGGLGLILGLLTPFVALLSALWMLSTTWFASSKLKKKYMGGYELDITLLLAALAIAVLGAGAYSLDGLLGW